MAKLIRRDGGTVNAYEDAVAFNFAFSNQSGVIDNILNKLEPDISTPNVFKIKSGMGVIQGRQFVVESEEKIDLNPAIGSTVYYYIVYAEIDMAATVEQDGRYYKGAISFRSTFYTNSYPSFPDGDDLNRYPSGKAYLPLYRFRQTSGGIIGIEKDFNLILSENPMFNTIRTFGAGSSFFKGFTIPYDSIPTTRVMTVADLTGSGSTIIQQSGILESGWYEIILAGGGGAGGGGLASGGAGGYLNSRFYVPYTVNYKIMAGGGGMVGTSNAGVSGGGGGGGGSVLDIPQLGILFIATGGGGGYGGGGGGYGGGGAGLTRDQYRIGGAGGAGGGNAGGTAEYNDILIKGVDTAGSGAGGGGTTGGNVGHVAPGGGTGGRGNTSGLGVNSGENGGNNINTTLGGGGNRSTGNGENGYARLYKLD